MALPRFTTPYYLAGRAKERFHTNQVEKSAVTAGLVGAGGYAISKHPQVGRFIAHNIANRTGIESSPRQISKAAYVAAGAVAAYGGYHAVRAGIYRHQEKKKKAKSSVRTSRTYGLSMPGSKRKEMIQNYNNQADIQYYTRKAKVGKGRGRVATQRIKNPNFGKPRRAKRR